MGARFRLARLLARILFNLFFLRPRVRGREHLEELEGPFLVASNHASNADPALLWGFFPEPLFFLAKQELRDAFPIGWISRTVGNIHVKRDGQDVGPLRQALRLLRSGDGNLAIFVQGHRTEAGKVLEAQAGAALLASRTGVPVIPVFLEGTGKVLPKGAVIPVWGQLTIHIGPPVDLGLPEGKATHEELETASGRIRCAIEALRPD